ncbi:UPF0280 family protein [Spirochaeta isovalerica]|uniref:Uncharacterized protein n=1 Tax=Spirochaeta isovalerica TaxID=150 RepID=A0A841R8Y1_9SPIO|nr:UPF0280 family protein [Spirochaeta isovalerica]MBB6480365.1 hypothetical protein [Spirochaeta isovalerica]
MKRHFREFHYKEAHFHILTSSWDPVTEFILSERLRLEAFILSHPLFGESLEPVSISPADKQPESVRRMIEASLATGLGPMAAVAGTMAQLAAEISADMGSPETIVENGGDIYVDCREDVTLGLYPGRNSPFSNLALRILPEFMPLGVCTSSGRMGHSLSFGDCDILTVFSKNASLADAAATLGCNSIRSKEDMEPVLNRLLEIPGIEGALAIRDGDFGAAGRIPELVKNSDPEILNKVSRDETSNFQ